MSNKVKVFLNVDVIAKLADGNHTCGFYGEALHMRNLHGVQMDVPNIAVFLKAKPRSLIDKKLSN